MMKNLKWILLWTIIVISTTLVAQHKPFQFGFTAGLNLGWFSSSNDGYKGEGANLGGSWGFAADFFILENYSFTTGVELLYLNGKMSYPALHHFDNVSFPTQGVIVREYKTKYIKVPLIFTMKTNEIGKLRYYGQLGVGISVLYSAHAKDEFTSDDGITDSESSNIYDDIYPTRESIMLGAGVEIPIHKSTYARVGLMFDNAFVNVLKGNNSVDPSLKNNGRNSYLELKATLLF